MRAMWWSVAAVAAWKNCLPGAVVGTSSRRRAANCCAAFPHLCIADLRGNVDTRIRKALEPAGPYDAIILAHAGIGAPGTWGCGDSDSAV